MVDGENGQSPWPRASPSAKLYAGENPFRDGLDFLIGAGKLRRRRS